MAVLEMLFKKASWRDRRFSSWKSLAFSTATETCAAAVFITSKSCNSNANSCAQGMATDYDGRTAERLRRIRRDVGDTQACPHTLEVRANQQRLPRAQDVLRQG